MERTSSNKSISNDTDDPWEDDEELLMKKIVAARASNGAETIIEPASTAPAQPQVDATTRGSNNTSSGHKVNNIGSRLSENRGNNNRARRTPRNHNRGSRRNQSTRATSSSVSQSNNVSPSNTGTSEPSVVKGDEDDLIRKVVEARAREADLMVGAGENSIEDEDVIRKVVEARARQALQEESDEGHSSSQQSIVVNEEASELHISVATEAQEEEQSSIENANLEQAPGAFWDEPEQEQQLTRNSGVIAPLIDIEEVNEEEGIGAPLLEATLVTESVMLPADVYLAEPAREEDYSKITKRGAWLTFGICVIFAVVLVATLGIICGSGLCSADSAGSEGDDGKGRRDVPTIPPTPKPSRQPTPGPTGPSPQPTVTLSIKPTPSSSNIFQHFTENPSSSNSTGLLNDTTPLPQATNPPETIPPTTETFDPAVNSSNPTAGTPGPTSSGTEAASPPESTSPVVPPESTSPVVPPESTSPVMRPTVAPTTENIRPSQIQNIATTETPYLFTNKNALLMEDSSLLFGFKNGTTLRLPTQEETAGIMLETEDYHNSIINSMFGGGRFSSFIFHNTTATLTEENDFPLRLDFDAIVQFGPDEDDPDWDAVYSLIDLDDMDDYIFYAQSAAPEGQSLFSNTESIQRALPLPIVVRILQGCYLNFDFSDGTALREPPDQDEIAATAAAQVERLLARVFQLLQRLLNVLISGL